MSVKTFQSSEEMFADLEARVEAGREAAKIHHIKAADLPHGSYFVYGHFEVGELIFGEVIEVTEYPEDNESIAQGRENGYIFARCYSVLCPEGELGDTHITRISRVISKEEFEVAKEAGWDFHKLC